MSRYATRHNKRDATEPAIVTVLAQMGLDWTEAGPLDGWIYYGGEWVPVEIKSPKGRVTTDQRDFIDLCHARGRPCFVWRSVPDVLKDLLLNHRGEWIWPAPKETP